MEGIDFFTDEIENENIESEDVFGEVDTREEDDDDMIEDNFDDVDDF
jgi:hypothetical protein